MITRKEAIDLFRYARDYDGLFELYLDEEMADNYLKSIASNTEAEKVCNPHHTVSIRWAHKCVDCGKIFEGN